MAVVRRTSIISGWKLVAPALTSLGIRQIWSYLGHDLQNYNQWILRVVLQHGAWWESTWISTLYHCPKKRATIVPKHKQPHRKDNLQPTETETTVAQKVSNTSVWKLALSAVSATINITQANLVTFWEMKIKINKKAFFDVKLQPLL